MRVVSSELSMRAEHTLAKAKTRTETLEAWVGRRPTPGSSRGDAAPQVTVEVTSTPPTAESPDRPAQRRDLLDLAILLRSLGATAEEVQNSVDRLAAAGAPQQVQSAEVSVVPAQAQAEQGWGVAYDRHEQSIEAETSTFQATGKVVTADGRTLHLSAELISQRIDIQTTSVSVRAGDAAKKVDPLVLNLDNAPVAFSGTQSFDLDADGTPENIARLSDGHVYLALDRNDSGAIEDGSELFGPATGNGFAELATQDSDGNGWIDEGDVGYSQLKAWSPSNGTLTSLADAGVGAIALQNVSTPFQVMSSGETQGYVAKTGVYLRENGVPGTIQHVDLTA